MRTYVLVSGVVFGLVTLAHLARIAAEPRLARDPVPSSTVMPGMAKSPGS